MGEQGLRDKQFNYQGSERWFYSGLTLTSGNAWAFVNYSGTNTGFGPDQNVLSQRFGVQSSGTSQMQWSWNSGTTLGGEIFGGEMAVFDGVSRSGVWVRAETAGFVKVFAW